MKNRSISAFLFTVLLGLGGLVTATPALAAASVISVSDGQISAKGTAVTGTYTVTCTFFDENININMELRQVTGKTVNSSSFSDSFLCEGYVGRVYTRTYRFDAFTGRSTIFVQGGANVTGNAQGFICCFYNVNEPINKEIRLFRKSGN